MICNGSIIYYCVFFLVFLTMTIDYDHDRFGKAVSF